jgi:hypothetical protein
MLAAKRASYGGCDLGRCAGGRPLRLSMHDVLEQFKQEK